MGKPRRPRMEPNSTADKYNRTRGNERICEFTFTNGKGGLISLYEHTNGTVSVMIYRQDDGVQVTVEGHDVTPYVSPDDAARPARVIREVIAKIRDDETARTLDAFQELEAITDACEELAERPDPVRVVARQIVADFDRGGRQDHETIANRLRRVLD
jgi:hypothetical protein